MVRRTTIGLLATLVGTSPALADPPQSTAIKDVVIDMSSLRQFADESDNFALTWHPNGSLYGAYGDGWGFGDRNVPKRSIGVSRFQNWPGNLIGSDTFRGDAQGGTWWAVRRARIPVPRFSNLGFDPKMQEMLMQIGAGLLRSGAGQSLPHLPGKQD